MERCLKCHDSYSLQGHFFYRPKNYDKQITIQCKTYLKNAYFIVWFKLFFWQQYAHDTTSISKFYVLCKNWIVQ